MSKGTPDIPKDATAPDKSNRTTEMIGWVLLIVSVAVGLGLTWFGPET